MIAPESSSYNVEFEFVEIMIFQISKVSTFSICRQFILKVCFFAVASAANGQHVGVNVSDFRIRLSIYICD